MDSCVCTLFDNHFHYGLAGLTNSLFKYGFRGPVYAGYRGALPEWCAKAYPDQSLGWEGALTLDVGEGLNIHFLPIETSYHLTNYKPDFMLRLIAGPAKSAESVIYFDPDIVLKCRWTFFEKWVSYGVALVHEIRANDMPLTHPIRMEWYNVIAKSGRQVTNKLESYINGGFCGVSRENFGFIQVWKDIMDTGIKYYGLAPEKFMPTDRTDPFFATDQDALNIAAMCCTCPISEIGPEGMDFIHGGWTMSHAVGSPKPWRNNYILNSFKGHVPELGDRAYWDSVDGPVKAYSPLQIKLNRLGLLIATFITRFYRKN